MDFTTAVLASAAFGILFLSGISHLLHPLNFRSLVRQQRVWSKAGEWLVVASVIVSEVAVGGLGLLALSTESIPMIRLSATLACVIYGLYAFYAAYLLRTRPGVPCACSSRAEPANIWTVARAMALATGSLVAVAAVGADWSDSVSASFLAPTVVASLSLAIVLWILPSALAYPPFAAQRHEPSDQEEK